MQHELRRTEMLLGAENMEKLHRSKVVRKFDTSLS